MSIMQIKRGTTDSWTIGPEMIDFNKLNVRSRDSIISCDGIKLNMNIFTSSASNFPGDPTGVKSYGLWVIDSSEIMLTNGVYFKTCLSMDCLASAGYSASLYGFGRSDGRFSEIATITPTEPSVQLNISGTEYSTIALSVNWDSKMDSPVPLTLTMSLKNTAGEEGLYPGQLGVEYTANDQIYLKVGTNALDGAKVPWSELPYITTPNRSFTIKFTGNTNLTSPSSCPLSVDKSFSECLQAYNSGQPIYCLCYFDNERFTGNLTYYDGASASPYFLFHLVNNAADKQLVIGYSASNSIQPLTRYFNQEAGCNCLGPERLVTSKQLADAIAALREELS